MTPARVFFVGLLVVAGMLYLLNPGPEAFGEFLTTEAAAKAEGSDTVSRFLATRTGRRAAAVASDMFERENLYLASIYTADFNGRMPGGEFRYLGIAGWFTPLEDDDDDR